MFSPRHNVFTNNQTIFYPISENSATESDDTIDSGNEKSMSKEKVKVCDPKRRVINKVSEKVLKVIESLTCNKKKKKSKGMVNALRKC